MFMINYEQVYSNRYLNSGQPKNTPLQLPEKFSENLPAETNETAVSDNTFSDISPEELLAKISDKASSLSQIASNVSSKIKTVLNSDETQTIIQATKDKASAGFDILKEKTVKAAQSAKTGALFVKDTVGTTATELKSKTDNAAVEIKEKISLTKEKTAEKINLVKEKTEKAAESAKTKALFVKDTVGTTATVLKSKTDNAAVEIKEKISLTKEKTAEKINLVKERTEKAAEKISLLKENTIHSSVKSDEKAQQTTEIPFTESNSNFNSTEYQAEKKHLLKPSTLIFSCLMSTALITSGIVLFIFINNSKTKENLNMTKTDNIVNVNCIETEHEENRSDSTTRTVNYETAVHDTGFLAGNKEELYASMTQILSNNTDFVTPSTCSPLILNNSGSEMFIVPDVINECFDLYLNRDGRIVSIKFGKFSSLSEIQFFKVCDMNNGNRNYIYYCCNYAHKSITGYYDPITEDQIRTEISYIEDSDKYIAEWKLFKICNSTETEVCSGNEPINEMYKFTASHNKSLHELFNSMNIKITDQSQYETVTRLSPKDTFNYLKNDSSVSTTEITTVTESTTATEPPPPVANEELGKIYNEYYFFTLYLFAPGWIEDADNDGVDNLIYTYDSSTYVCSYENGTIVKKYSPGYHPKSRLLQHDELTSIYRQKAFDNGFDINYYYTNDSPYLGKITTQGGHLNLRNAPSMDGSILTELPNSLFINIYGFYDRNGFNIIYSDDQIGWYEIRVYYNGQYLSGYVSADYVKFIDISII